MDPLVLTRYAMKKFQRLLLMDKAKEPPMSSRKLLK